jgi:hypothetical protein
VPASPDQSSADETLVQVAFDESNPSFLQHNGNHSQLNEFERLLEAGASEGTTPTLQPFNINDALNEFAARSRSPSVIVVPDTGSDTSTFGSGYVSSDDEPNADYTEFNPIGASTGGLPQLFNEATLEISTNLDDSQGEQESSSASQASQIRIMSDNKQEHVPNDNGVLPIIPVFIPPTTWR